MLRPDGIDGRLLLVGRARDLRTGDDGSAEVLGTADMETGVDFTGNWGWVELSGRAEVFSFSVMHGYPGLPEITIVAAVLDLPDAPGARLISNIVDVDPSTVAIGDRVEVFFSPIADGWKIPLFRPLGRTSERPGSAALPDRGALFGERGGTLPRILRLRHRPHDLPLPVPALGQ
jgi:hypothetical protein